MFEDMTEEEIADMLDIHLENTPICVWVIQIFCSPQNKETFKKENIIFSFLLTATCKQCLILLRVLKAKQQ